MGFFSKIGGAFKKAATSTWSGVKKTAGKTWNTAKKAGKIVQSAADRVTGGLISKVGKIIGSTVKFTNSLISRIESTITDLIPYGSYLIPLIEMSQPQLAVARQLLARGEQMSDFLVNGELDIKSMVTTAITSRVPGYGKLDKLAEHVGVGAQYRDQIKGVIQEGAGLAKQAESTFKRGQDVVKGVRSGKLSRKVIDDGIGSLPQSLVRDQLAKGKFTTALNEAVGKNNRFLNKSELKKSLKQFSNHSDVMRNTKQTMQTLATGLKQSGRNKAALAQGLSNQLRQPTAKAGGRNNPQLNRVDTILKNVQNRRRRRR